MIVLELDQVEIDYCQECGGVWLDAGELELLLGDMEQVTRLLDSFSLSRQSGEEIHKCPLCRKKMQKIRAGTGADAPLIDRCPSNEGLWFDRGELAMVLKQGSLGSEHKITKLLADIFNSKGDQI
jgi:Zn-finger nucleic acid-binding protein